MSEADNTWRITTASGEHDVEVDHSTITGKIVVTLDGTEVGEERMMLRKKEVRFDIDNQSAVVEVAFAYGGLGAKSEMHVDGRYVEPLRR